MRSISSDGRYPGEERSERVLERSAIVPVARRMVEVSGEGGGGVREVPGEVIIGGEGEAADMRIVAIVARAMKKVL